MDFMESFVSLVPSSPSEEIDWQGVNALLGVTCFADMKSTAQNPLYHGEGDVYTHTQMVYRELANSATFHALNPRQKAELFLAAILHDIGKVKTTRIENGDWVSPHHAATGSHIVRRFLWEDCGLCGKTELFTFRETVCALVRHHMLPVHLSEHEDVEREVRKVAAIGELASDFSWKLLCMLAEADVRGRMADDIEEGLIQVQLTGLLAEECGCLEAPYGFTDNHTKHAYFSGRSVPPDQPLFDDSWGEIIMLSGLPGTGKDTWIKAHLPNLPTVSLDDIRSDMHIRPTDNQGLVIQVAKERARVYLRERQPFVWNATNLTKETRQKLIGLFERYGARVRIVYLETDRKSRFERNRNRPGVVPERAVERMLGKTEPPTPDEAQWVEWICV